MDAPKLRNIAIIAHVDHGKTTLVDALLKQSHTFAAHQAEMQQTTIMDKNELERERGVTILAKNTSVNWEGYKINILDTPGHADFSGEVERVLNMADGCILLVDAAEGVLSQTRYVLSLALELGLKPLVVINKVDRKDQRAHEVLEEINNLFLDTAQHEHQLEFPVLYAIAREGTAGHQTELNTDHSLRVTDSTDLSPLFEMIIKQIPAPTEDPTLPFQMQVNNIDYDSHKGRITIGRIHQGTIKNGDQLTIIRKDQVAGKGRVEYLYTFHGLDRQPITSASAGDIIALMGFPEIQIGDTLTDPTNPVGLPDLPIAEPTLQLEILVSTSPFVGRDGKFTTARQIGQRLTRELETNVSLRINPGGSGENFTVSGRGELHLSILIETMRREGFEFSVSRPQVIFKEVDGQMQEPWEQLTVEVPTDFQGTVINAMGIRKAVLKDMQNLANTVKLTYHIATRNLIGYRSELLTQTSGAGIMHSVFIGYQPKGPDVDLFRNGVIVSTETGKALAYSLERVQERATTFIEPGEDVYVGMIVGLNSRQEDMWMNVIKGKKLTNTRAAAGDDIIKLAPPLRMSLEQCLTFLAQDELLEVTPHHLRLRKRNLTAK